MLLRYGNVIFHAILPAVWQLFFVLVAGTHLYGQTDGSILFKVESLSLDESDEDRCVQVGLFLTSLDPAIRSWSVLNATLNYRAPDELLFDDPVVRLSDFDDSKTGLSYPAVNHTDHSGHRLVCSEENTVNSVTETAESEIPFAAGTGNGSLFENLNSMTGRIEILARGNGKLFSSTPGENQLFAVITFPVKAGSSGSVDLQFTRDSLVLDGNILVDPSGRQLTAYTLDGSVNVKSSWFRLSSLQWLNLSFITILLFPILYYRRQLRPSYLVLGFFLVGICLTILVSGLSITSSGIGEKPERKRSVSISEYGPKTDYQFEYDSIKIPAAYRFEPRLPQTNVKAAVQYLDLGVKAWNRKYNCIGCHTTGTYLMVRPMLTSLYSPSGEVRRFVLESFKPYLKQASETVLSMGHRSAQVVYAAAGLASWDRYVEGEISESTSDMLQLMFRLQTFMTYSATAFVLLSLWKCNSLARPNP